MMDVTHRTERDKDIPLSAATKHATAQLKLTDERDESNLTRQIFHLVYSKHKDSYHLKVFCYVEGILEEAHAVYRTVFYGNNQ